MPFYTKNFSTTRRFLMAASLVGTDSKKRERYWWLYGHVCVLCNRVVRTVRVKMGVDKEDQPVLGTHPVHQKF